MKNIVSVINFITAVIALIAAVFGFIVANKSLKTSRTTKKKLITVESQLSTKINNLERKVLITSNLTPIPSQTETERIVITKPKLKKQNRWNDPQVATWMENPIGFGDHPRDGQFPIEGKVFNPPTKGFVRLFVILTGGRTWPQGEYELESNGKWTGAVYLRMGERYRKIIRVELYEGEGLQAKKIDTYDVVIE